MFDSGVPALFASRLPDKIADALPPEPAGRRRATSVMGSRQARAIADEFAAMEQSLAEVQGLRRPLGELPVAVIAHGIAVTEGVPEHLRPAVEEAWQKMQADLAGISTRAALLHADHSGHNIPTEQPEIITRAIRDMLDGETPEASAAA